MFFLGKPKKYGPQVQLKMLYIGLPESTIGAMCSSPSSQRHTTIFVS